MGLFSGITSSLINPVSLAQLAMGPAGWASLAMRTIGAAIAKEVIQQLGQQLGLPQGVINMARERLLGSDRHDRRPGLDRRGGRRIWRSSSACRRRSRAS
jgi:hypothetical protein